jgi:hypothetical protein
MYLAIGLLWLQYSGSRLFRYLFAIRYVAILLIREAPLDPVLNNALHFADSVAFLRVEIGPELAKIH